MILARTPTVALVGNPNTGKTTLFNALAGMRQRVGNYPGVTVETKKGHLRHHDLHIDLVDLPGTYSLAPRSPDEMVAVDLILGHQQGERRPDVVLAIVDASNLERNLYLTTQVLEFGVPVVVALNMIDVAESQGIHIDAERLSAQLGVPVIPVQANKRKGLEQLKQAITGTIGAPCAPKGPTFPVAFEQEVADLHEAVGGGVSVFLIRRLLLDVGGYTERRLAEQCGGGLVEQIKAARQRLAAAGCAVPAVEARTRYAWIREATTGCIRRPAQRVITCTDRIDRVLTHREWGTALFLSLMFVVFEAIFVGARPLMDLIRTGQLRLAGLIQNDAFLAPGPLRSLLADGVVKGVGSVLIFLPQIVILFGFIAVLEDCGYMARAAFLMDRLMARCGLSGKSFIPMLSSVACAVPGIMAARVIENRRDRLATILVSPLMSCSARLPVYFILIGAFLGPEQGYPWWLGGVTLFAMYMLGLVLAPLVALLLKRTLLRGETPVFVMEMPLYKWPSAATVLHRMFDSGWMFVRRAGTLILASMVVIWALLYFPATAPDGSNYDLEVAARETSIRAKQESGAPKEEIEELEQEVNRLRRDWTGRSILGQVGHAIEPVVRPLGWDWRIGMATLASFPAREVIVGTLGIIYNLGEGEADDVEFQQSLGSRLREQRWDDDPDRPVYTIPVVLSIMVFFALCCQCASTLAVIRRETNSWGWPALTFVYMTVLAYVGALLVYQIGSLFV